MKSKLSLEKRVIIALGALCIFLNTHSMTNALFAYIMNSYAEVPANTLRQILTIPGLVGLVVSLMIGAIATKINKRYLLLGSGLCVFSYFMIFYFVGGNGPYWLLILAAVLIGLNQGAIRTLTTALIADLIEPAKQASFCAFTTAMLNGGAVLFNLLGGKIAAGNGGADWPKAYLLGLLLIPMLAIYFWMIPKDTTKQEAVQEKQVQADEPGGKIPVRAILAALLNATFSISVCAYLYCYSEYVITTYQLGTSVETGICNAIYLALGLIGLIYPVFTKIFKRFITPIGYALFALGMLLMVLVHNSIYVVYFSVFLIGLGFNIGNPLVSAYVIRITPKKWVPVALSILFAGSNIGVYLSTYVLGAVGSLFGGGTLGSFTAGCIGGVLCAVLAFFLYSMDPATQVVVGEKSAD